VAGHVLSLADSDNLLLLEAIELCFTEYDISN
jgi:hypothetical protein